MGTRRSRLNARAARIRRHVRVRKSVQGTAERPRLAVFRSNSHIYCQIIDDDARCTLAAASDDAAAPCLSPSIKLRASTVSLQTCAILTARGDTENAGPASALSMLVAGSAGS